MIREKQDGQDLVQVAVDPQYGGAAVEATRINGVTGKVTLAALACPGTMLQDTWDKIAADASAATATAEHMIFRAAGPLTVKSVQFIPDTTLTASDTNYATITLSVRNADGTNAQTVATVKTQTSGSGGTGNWTAWVAVNVPVSAAVATLTAGQILTIAITKASAGVVVPWGSFAINYVLV